MGWDGSSWMERELLQDVVVYKDLPLKSIVLPASHDSAMSICNNPTNYANDENTLTQLHNIERQLQHGIRVFDIRPVIKNSEYVSGHYDYVEAINSWQGGFGESINGIVQGVNGYLDSHHHELVVLNIHDFSGYNADAGFKEFTDQEWAGLFELLKKIKYLFNAATDCDLTKQTVSQLIKDRSTVLCIISVGRGENQLGGLHGKGFFKASQWYHKDLIYSLSVTLPKWYYGGEGILAAIQRSNTPLGIALRGSKWFSDFLQSDDEKKKPLVYIGHQNINLHIPTLKGDIGSNADRTPKHPIVQADGITDAALAEACWLATVALVKAAKTP